MLFDVEGSKGWVWICLWSNIAAACWNAAPCDPAIAVQVESPDLLLIISNHNLDLFSRSHFTQAPIHTSIYHNRIPLHVSR